ncbi:hypothetical protein RIF29_23993 [Crotalaria pallida]|uniref:F-box associated beta-propeller type 1 domain-containing protein n=1 Tax=Crotalaria pallida TaxID=3830 RepID=A0AAN9EJI3_CROPI
MEPVDMELFQLKKEEEYNNNNNNNHDDEKNKMKVSSAVVLLPQELIDDEILVRLPAKSLMRFKCVVRSDEVDDVVPFSLEENNVCYAYGSHKGFFCLHRLVHSPKLILWNPLTRELKHIDLPSHHIHDQIATPSIVHVGGIGSDPNDTYDLKIVLLISGDNNRHTRPSAALYTLSTNSWTFLYKNTVPVAKVIYLNSFDHGVYVNGDGSRFLGPSNKFFSSTQESQGLVMLYNSDGIPMFGQSNAIFSPNNELLLPLVLYNSDGQPVHHFEQQVTRRCDLICNNVFKYEESMAPFHFFSAR